MNLTPENLGAAAADRTHPEYLKKTEYVTAGKQDGVEPGLFATSEGFATVATGTCSHAEGTNTTASASDSHAEGFNTSVTEQGAHAEGYNASATGRSAHAEGISTVASGTCSHAEGGSNTTASGSYSHAEGAATRAEGHYAHAEGYNSIAEGAYSHASGYFAYALDCQTAIGICNDPKSVVTFGAQGNGTLFVVGNGVNATRRNVFRVQQDGKCFGTGSWNTFGADYAEMFEWVDGNEANEDRRGLFVTLDGEKIRLATSNDDYVLGVISANPVILGDNDDDWHGRYLKDVFGQRIYESYINEEGETVERWKVNPDYDPEKQKDYVLREDRKEWAKVGMLGKIVVVDDGTCEVNGYCYPGARGIGTKAETGYRVMKRIDDTHVTVLIR